MIGASCAKGGTRMVEGIAKSSRDSLPRHYAASKHTYSVCYRSRGGEGDSVPYRTRVLRPCHLSARYPSTQHDYGGNPVWEHSMTG